MGEGYCKVGRSGVPARGEAGRRIEVEFVRDSVIRVSLSLQVCMFSENTKQDYGR